MATNNLSSKIILEPLTYYNYEDWSAWMKNYLLAQDLWDIVEGTGKPEDDFKAWRKNNAAALHAILISCEVDILSKIRKISSAKIVWEKLASMYGPDRSCGGYRNYSTTVAYCMAKNLRIFQEAEHVEPPGIPIRTEHSTNETFINIRHIEPQSNREEISIPELGQLRRPTSNLLKLLGFKKIYEMKLLHHQACQLLDQMCNQVEQMNLNHVNRAIFQAIKGGIIEFIVAILKKDFQLLNTIDAMKRDTFFCAVLHRQEKIFDLLCMHNARNSITNAVDRFGCTILHMAATLEPCTTRDRISGEALKMQSEVQWFKKVEKIFPPQLHEIRNNTNMTARELFTHNHKKMMKEGETWTKETASACIMVGGLIITIMFTAAFTVPGGNDQNTGFPMFSDKTLFTVFTIFDALSLLFASVSVLIFLGSITSRYAEEDFFKFLPSNMIIGHYTLFFSIATMMIAFCAGLFIMVHGKLWIVIPAICLAFGTVYKFASMLLPLFDHMLKRMSTHELGTRYLRRWFKANNFDK